MLLSVERDVVMMQEEAVKPPPSTASSGLRATDFSIAAIMARESPGQPASASWPSAAASSGEWSPVSLLLCRCCSTAAFTGSPLRQTFENGRHRAPAPALACRPGGYAARPTRARAALRGCTQTALFANPVRAGEMATAPVELAETDPSV
ncbi:hypothetical protein HPB50_013324 [Hyalomma asiaticum]|uniref:Uncharacterized protein n=1 Tax=Hyalomma asiaticum TaxID=266040 RepID=A0ACB7TH63_HYAAI|nr:hypothetical protein HPB50_013324 [Hyalomma asiaticum]